MDELWWRLRRSADPDVQELLRDWDRLYEKVGELEPEVANLKGALAADDARSRAAAERAAVTFMGCDTVDHLADEIEGLRDDLAEAKRDTERLKAELERLKDGGNWLALSGGKIGVSIEQARAMGITVHLDGDTPSEQRKGE